MRKKKVKKIKDLPNERWVALHDRDNKPLPESEFHYMISDHGRVKRIDLETGEEVLRKFKDVKGRNPKVFISIRKQKFKIPVGEAVAKVWVEGQSEERIYVIYIDGKRENNHFSNLKWVSKENWKKRAYEFKKKGSNALLVSKIRSHWNERWDLLKSPEGRTETNTGRQYFISDHGRVKSVSASGKSERLLSLRPERSGCLTFSIRFGAGNGPCTSFLTNREVAKRWIEGETEQKCYVIHLDGDKNNNHYQNLKWVTRDELTQHQYDIGMYDNNYSQAQKLTYSQVILLKKKLKEGKTKPKILARNFNITLTQVKRIARGENWKHVKV